MNAGRPGCDVEHFRQKANFLKGTLTRSTHRQSDRRGALLLHGRRQDSPGYGLEPVMQMVTRDMNRIALQSNILGAAALASKICSA